MSLLRRLLFAGCIALAAGSRAQGRSDQLLEAPQVQKPDVPTPAVHAADPAGPVSRAPSPAQEVRKARLALLSQITSKSPSQERSSRLIW